MKHKTDHSVRYYILLFFRTKMYRVITSKHFSAFFKEMICSLMHKDAPLKDFDEIKRYFSGKNGLEIGGPSAIFSSKSILPIYGIAKNLDNCNCYGETVWEGRITEGLTFNYYGNKVGYQFLSEATDLKGIKSESYEFVVSAHVLEHVANPLKALFEWKRVLKNGGVLLLVIPHKQYTFDHVRPVTRLKHLIQDYENETDEHDMRHLSEALSLHDLLLDTETLTYDSFVARTKDNFKNRCLHHHVFATEEVIHTVDHIGLKILFVRAYLPLHIIICGQKIPPPSENEKVENHKRNIRLLDESAFWRRTSPFTLDEEIL